LIINYKCHPEQREGSRNHKEGVTEILPPFGRLNDTMIICYTELFPLHF